MTAEIIYTGELRTTATHIASGNEIVTDAPVDNHGKGEAFSPTDLASTSLATCMLTVMGILARNKGINIEGTKAKVLKVMASDPRRISKIEIEINFPESENYSEKEKDMLKHTALTCPVALSLHPDIIQEITFNF